MNLSPTSLLYAPVGPPEKLRADLRMFTDPAQYDQDDPQVQSVVDALRAKLNGQADAADDGEIDAKTLGHMRALCTDEEEVQELIRDMRRKRRFRAGR
ncbi:MAG: hypothetical protein HLUCCA12_16420 [Rhodobacteraceae bacterium HLUCCA12]|nr:MAG: hypothetical protein HLUCCA12_16420 [Rhodobacteraceae bacterium HLUCCA12]